MLFKVHMVDVEDKGGNSKLQNRGVPGVVWCYPWAVSTSSEVVIIWVGCLSFRDCSTFLYLQLAYLYDILKVFHMEYRSVKYPISNCLKSDFEMWKVMMKLHGECLQVGIFIVLYIYI